jgi:hypothetical protein
MMPPVAQPPEDEPDDVALPALDEVGLDPEDAPVEVDDDGFLVSDSRGWRFPTDLDAWVGWAGAVIVAVAACETLAFLIEAALDGWAPGLGNVTLPRPDGYYALLVLGGVLFLVLRTGGAGSDRRPRWAGGAACLAAGTGGALVVAGLVSNIAVLLDPSGSVVGTVADPYAPPEVAAAVVGALAGCVAALLAAFAATLAVLLYRRLQLGDPEAGIQEAGTGDGPRLRRVVPMGPVMASLLIGAAAAAACLAAFQAGVASNPNDLLTSPPETSAAPVTSAPSPTPESIPGQVFTLPSGCSVEASGVGLIYVCPVSGSVPTITATPGPLT